MKAIVDIVKDACYIAIFQITPPAIMYFFCFKKLTISENDWLKIGLWCNRVENGSIDFVYFYTKVEKCRTGAKTDLGMCTY